ncbi:MAG: hypothetical protein MK008_09800 [Bdellovibrionales bacterium]|nr:hypothetical protein [Bdellovibrionales bacterium]
MKIIVGLCLLVFLTGCDLRFSEDKPEIEQESFNINKNELLEISFKETDKLNQFNMEVSSGDYALNVATVNDKRHYLKNGKVVIENVTPMTEFKVDLGRVDGGQFIAATTEVVESPYDIKITEDFEVSDDIKLFFEGKPINRLIINEEHPIVTQGRDVILNIKKLISNKGTIRTFPEGSKAPDNKHGLSGGNIELNIEKAEGQLEVILSGQNAGEVTNLPNNEWNIDNLSPIHCAARRLTPPTSATCLEFEVGYRAICSGKDGLKGLDGRNGGDSGNLRITIKDSEDFQLKHTFIKSNPSTGGPGGRPFKPTWFQFKQNQKNFLLTKMNVFETQYPRGSNPVKHACYEKGKVWGVDNESCVEGQGYGDPRPMTCVNHWTDGPSGEDGSYGSLGEVCIKLGNNPMECR